MNWKLHFDSAYNPDQSDKEIRAQSPRGVFKDSELDKYRDKEMFDAQLISGLKDRVKELEDGIITALESLSAGNSFSERGVYEIESLLPKEKQE